MDDDKSFEKLVDDLPVLSEADMHVEAEESFEEFCDKLPPVLFDSPPPVFKDIPYTEMYDDDDDIKFMKWLFTGPDRLSPTEQLAFISIPWEKLLETPLYVGLPSLIYFKPSNPKESKLPTGKLWAILMTLNFYGTSKKPRVDGVVFVIGNQYQCMIDLLSNLTYGQLFDWAIKNVPETLRFHSLAFALKTMCGTIYSPYPVKPPRSDGYFGGTKCWTVAEWNMSIEQLVNTGTEFFPSEDSLPKHMVPVKPKNKPRTRKRTENKDQ